VTKVGGITEFLKVVKLGMRVAPHSPYFGPGAIATLHLIAALLPQARFEYFYLSADATLYPGLFGKSVVEIPNAAIEPDLEVIQRYRA
jgi:D-galactarolactone cycloisomerase